MTGTRISAGASTANTFVLVHGAWHGGWCYSRVAELLRAKGHRVFTPTLTGLGERSHLLTDAVNCSTHIQDVVNVIEWEQLTDVVLCGHSYGGVVVGAVADQLFDRIQSLVYLDAAIPLDGVSPLGLTANEATPDIGRRVQESADGVTGIVPPIPAADFNVNEEDRDLVDRLCTNHPLATLTEPISLSGKYMQIPDLVYVRATDWEGSDADLFRSRVKDLPGWTLHDIHCGHDIMLDRPDELAEILLAAGRRAEADDRRPS